jgi:GntR family transcriptional regulator
MPLVVMMLPESDPLQRTPAYHQLHDRLRRLALSGEIPPGGRFPTERELALRYRVSRVTANKALSQLVMEGLLQFRPGIGTFVRKEALELDLGALVSFTQKARLAGRIPSTRVLEFERVDGRDLPDIALQELGGTAPVGVFRIVRLRLADGIPVILERRHLRADVCPELRREELEGSLYERLRQETGLRLTGADQVLGAVPLEPSDASLLQVAPGSAGLRVHAIGRAVAGPVWVEDTLYRGDLFGFVNTITIDQPPRPGRITSMSGFTPASQQPTAHILR